MQGCVHVGDEALYQLARRASRLQLVNLQGCRQVGTLSTMQGTTLTVQITDEGIAELAESSPALHYLCISTCVNLTDASLVALGRHCGQLVTIECAGVSQLTDHGFQVLPCVRHCPLLDCPGPDARVSASLQNGSGRVRPHHGQHAGQPGPARHRTTGAQLTLHHHSLSIS